MSKKDINAIAFTGGVGLLGYLLAGILFAKAFSLAMDTPLARILF